MPQGMSGNNRHPRALARLPFATITDPSLPPIANAALRVNFTRDRVIIDRCSGGSMTTGKRGSILTIASSAKLRFTLAKQLDFSVTSPQRPAFQCLSTKI